MKITRAVLESYLKCRTKAHLQLVGEQGSRSDYELLLGESRGRVRRAGMTNLLDRQKEGQVLQGVPLTQGVLEQGVPLLLNATIEDDDLSICFEALMRVAGPSRLGDFHYVPVLFHETERPGREQRALLELFGLLLGELQGREPGWGILIHGRGGNMRRFKLRRGSGQAQRTLQEIREMKGTSTPPRLILNSHCQVCEFRQRCQAEATAKDDLSLLRGMSEKEIKKYSRRGIFTVTQLSCTFRPRKRRKRAKQNQQPHQHSLQALAIRDKKIYVLGTPELPSSSVRIYCDIEGDPERRFDYLVGLIVEANGVEERHSFWADTPAEESRLFQQFLDVVGKYEDFCLYSYGSYEAAFVRRMSKESGRPELIERLLSRLVNVLSVVHSHVYFPTYTNGLKDIAGYLGFRWSQADASGIQSIVWRRRWEETGSPTFKDLLTTYNLEDCAALRKVTEFCLLQSPMGRTENVSHSELLIARVEDINPQTDRPDWGHMAFALPDFTFINERAHFDYQRDRVYVRTSEAHRQRRKRRRNRQGKKDFPANRQIEITGQTCPCCGGTALTRRPHGSLARLAFDLRISRSGIRRWVTRYTTAWHYCSTCGQRFLPGDYLRLEEFCHSLKSWAMYEYVAHRTSQPNIADTLRECFGLPIHTSQVYDFKELLARYYQDTYRRLLEKLVAGSLIQGDETEVYVRRVGKAYVWVFTNLEEVVYLYRPSREGEFLHDLFMGFQGVFVSDFYAAYDSLPCQQQKCLVHLIRDFNQDIRANPWDEEFKSLASDFGSLLRRIVATIERYGLKQRHFGKHRRDVDQFFCTLSGKAYLSEVAEGYQKRLLKYRGKLFTFLNHDGVPWNNNNAEHAVKGFAYYREVADNLITETGLNQYLVLLSVYQTCKYKGVSFLKFLLSRETDIDVFRERRGTRKLPEIELYPEGSMPGRPSRKRLRIPASVGKP